MDLGSLFLSITFEEHFFLIKYSTMLRIKKINEIITNIVKTAKPSKV